MPSFRKPVLPAALSAAAINLSTVVITMYHGMEQRGLAQLKQMTGRRPDARGNHGGNTAHDSGPHAPPAKHHYSAISIIYNPISTGPSKTFALRLRRHLRQALPGMKAVINAVPTEYARHAEALAYELAKAGERPLIIASGGDGSYHEIVNGAMKAQAEGAHPVCGLLPGGNANDHHRALHRDPVEDMIVSGRTHVIDLLHIETRKDGRIWQRYAHSYCGFGLTAEAGRELNKYKLNRLKEAWLVMRTFRRLQSKRVLVRGRKRAYTSLVVSNIHRMSKVLKLSDEAKPHDGKFEITAVRGRSKRRLVMSMFLASTRGFPEVDQSDRFIFTTIRPLRLQIDGEIYKIDGNTEVRVTIAPRILRCVV